MHDAPEIDVQQPLPGITAFPRLAGIVADAGIVHQHRNRTERTVGEVREPVDFVGLGDVGGDRENGIVPGNDGDRLPGLVEAHAAYVGKHGLHAHGREALRGGQAYAAGATGDDGDIAGGESGQGGLDFGVAGHG